MKQAFSVEFCGVFPWGFCVNARKLARSEKTEEAGGGGGGGEKRRFVCSRPNIPAVRKQKAYKTPVETLAMPAK